MEKNMQQMGMAGTPPQVGNGTPSDINIDLVAKVVQHDYFKSMVKEEAQNQTRDALSTWWKIIAGTAGAVLTILAIFGAKTIMDINKQVADIEKTRDKITVIEERLKADITTVTGLTKEAQEKINLAHTQLQAFEAHAKDVSKHADEDINRSDRWSKIYQEALGEISKGLKDSVKQAETINKQNESLTKRGLDQLEAAQTKLEAAKSELVAIKKMKADVDSLNKQIQDNLEVVKNIKALDVELKKAKTFGFIMLQANDVSRIELPDYENPGIKYPITFSTDAIGNHFPLHIQVEPMGRGKETGEVPPPQLEPRLIKGDKRRINHTNGLWFEVAAVRHRWLAHDFVLLRIFVN